MASPKEKFDAAVSVITSLPKNGPFQPSHEMMLSFYGYYKQATEGPCTLPKPGFWDVVRKAKWEAWQKLGNMPREEAMLNYVEELKKTVKIFSAKWDEMNKSSGNNGIVEAMPQTPTVGNFMGKIGAFYELVDEPSPVEEAMTVVNGTSIRQSVPTHNSSDLMTEEENLSRRVELQLEKEMTTLVSIQKPIETDVHKLTIGDTAETQSTEPSETILRSKDHVVSESESDEEFCDSSDLPTAEFMERIARGQPRLETYVSTPVKPLSGRPYHVHFSDNPHSEESISNGTLSPIRTSLTDNMPFFRDFPFIQRGTGVSLSDSLLVNGEQTQFSLDARDGSYLNFVQEKMDLKKEELNLTSNNNSYFLTSPNDRTGRGGEETSPPEGSSSQGQSSGARRRLRTGGAVPPGYQSSSEQQLMMGERGLGGSGGNQNDPPQHSFGYQVSVNEQVVLALLRLQQDMNRVLERLNQIEIQSRQVSSWWRWPFSSLSARTIFIILVWPFIVHFILKLRFHRKRR
ncbi:hypothetical protein CHS0354_019670 [Potamilus streckersoni]|uniref:ACB domain-containing protein n=1 Tax=Potamilus streckersoni TaxID=2493646 RepID=A0AAE0T9T9_9BIVA|nr:hypothetical protein CHS0354_019670 [Potamilus streckersoni]